MKKIVVVCLCILSCWKPCLASRGPGELEVFCESKSLRRHTTLYHTWWELEEQSEMRLSLSGFPLRIQGRLVQGRASWEMRSILYLQSQISFVEGIENRKEAQFDRIIEAIDGVESLERLEDLTKQLADGLESAIILPLEDEVSSLDESSHRLLQTGGRIEKRLDYLRYMMTKLRLYGKPRVGVETFPFFHQAVLAVCAGERVPYISQLSNILKLTRKYRGDLVKSEAADRIRYKADYLLRRVQSAWNTSDLNAGISWRLSPFYISLEGRAEGEKTRAPSDRRRRLWFGGQISYRSPPDSLDFDYDFKYREYEDSLERDKQRIVNGGSIDVTREFGSHEIWGTLDLQKDYYPRAVDDEFPKRSVSRALDEVNALRRTISSAEELSREVKEKAMGFLDSTRTALQLGRREEGVDYLEDLLDYLRDQLWEGELSSGLGKDLTHRTMALLPSKRRTVFDLSGGGQFSLAPFALEMSGGNKFTLYPADTVLNRKDRTGRGEIELQPGNIEAILRFEFQRREYPLASRKNWRERGQGLEVQMGGNRIDMEVNLARVTVSYPHRQEKDSRTTEGELEVCFPLSTDSEAEVEYSRQRTIYPHNSDVLYDRSQESTFQVETDKNQLSVQVEYGWSRESSFGERYRPLADEETEHYEIRSGLDLSSNLDLEAAGRWEKTLVAHQVELGENLLELAAGFEWSF
ncbi:MAG: hypothetical protein ACOCZX_03940 [Candidatus Bipolaricaulota bacterium]